MVPPPSKEKSPLEKNSIGVPLQNWINTKKKLSFLVYWLSNEKWKYANRISNRSLKYLKDSHIWIKGQGEGVLGCFFLHKSPKMYNNVFLVVGLTTLGTFIGDRHNFIVHCLIPLDPCKDSHIWIKEQTGLWFWGDIVQVINNFIRLNWLSSSFWENLGREGTMGYLLL